jgi:hypothetical protein
MRHPSAALGTFGSRAWPWNDAYVNAEGKKIASYYAKAS